MKLPVRRAHQLEARPEQQRWLIEQLWTDEAVGIVGGAPKCCKSFCALDMAVSVASGALCLGHFRPSQTGRVLLFAGEDPLSVVRERLEGISQVAGRKLDELDLLVITQPKLRLDVDDDRTRLSNTIETLRPKLLLLDPFVRLHSCDENAVAEVAPLLDYLRALQRNYNCSVLLVHHARKNAGSLRGGQALRGSSELFAWTDSNVSLRRKGEQLLLGAEHRSAPGLEELPVELRGEQGGMALRVADATQPSAVDTSSPLVDGQILEALNRADRPMTARQLRDLCRVRMARIYEALTRLSEAGTITREGSGYRSPNSASATAP